MLHSALAAAIIVVTGTLIAPAAKAQNLQFGVVPNVSAQIILTNYQPFRTYLARELARGVDIVTAPDFKKFHERTMTGDYDVVVSAANLARLAQVDGGLRPVATYEPRMAGVLVHPKSAPFPGVQALRGKTVAATNPQSLVALKFGHWVRAQGITPGSDFTIVHARTEDGLAQLLTGGAAPLAVMSMGEYRALSEATRQLLVIHSEFVSVPGFVILTSARMPPAESERIERLVLAFPATTEGQKFFELSFVRGIRSIGASDLSAIDDVIDETRALMR